jgi:hypothetical protein
VMSSGGTCDYRQLSAPWSPQLEAHPSMTPASKSHPPLQNITSGMNFNLSLISVIIDPWPFQKARSS